MTMLGNSFTINYHKKVVKNDIPSIHSPYKETIKKNIEDKLGKDPLAYSKPLKGNLKGLYRLRVGDYRIVFVVDETTKTVTILAIKHRQEVYDSL